MRDDEISMIVLREIELRKSVPVDLLGLGDADGEYKYLLGQKNSYVRTVIDLAHLLSGTAPQKVRVLEIGAYLGIVSISLAKLGFQIDAFDLREFCRNERLQALYRQSGIKLCGGDLSEYRLPYDDDAFDAVVTCETLEHLNFNPLPVLREINRVTRSGGKIYIAMPNGASMRRRLSLLRGQSIANPISDYFQQVDRRYNMLVGLHWREYMAYETQEMLRGIGYNVLSTYFFEPTDMEPKVRLRSWLGKLLRDHWPELRRVQVVTGEKIATPHFEHWRV